MPTTATLPQKVNQLLQDRNGQASTYPFPPNLAEQIPPETRRQVLQWMIQNYVWPQIMDRKPFERQWDKLYQMVRANWSYYMIDMEEDSRIDRARKERIEKAYKDFEADQFNDLEEKVRCADTVIFDAVDRLTNLNHFISFKESLPVRYELPIDLETPYENQFYSPTGSLIKSFNCWLNYNAAREQIYRRQWILARHHYTYGVGFVYAPFRNRAVQELSRQADGQYAPEWELEEIGLGYEPLSIRKLWLNWQISPDKFDYQPCPFFFDQYPRFALSANQYNPQTNPFGYSNIQNVLLSKPQYLMGAPEMEQFFKHFRAENNSEVSMQTLLKPEYNVEMRWTFFPVLPFDPQSMTFDHDGSLGIPLTRFEVVSYGNNLTTGSQEIISLRQNYYPKNKLPIFATSQMPDLDSGAYPIAIGTILEGYFRQINKCMEQYLENKDQINDPPTLVLSMSPAMTKRLNRKGSKIPVNSLNDLKYKDTPDATQTTPKILDQLRDKAQTSSKTVDAILGKAMGARTSATEASNVFQTAMSGATTDINLFNFDSLGQYADRLYIVTGRWIDPDILRAITGSYGFAITQEHLHLKLNVVSDMGSAFIESLTRQQNIRYLLETTQPGDPAVNRAELLRMLLKEWKFKNVDKIINDGGLNQQIQLATEQAIKTYMGDLVLVDPEQNHEIAIATKRSFLADPTSVWNTDPRYVQNGQRLVPQLQQHQQFLLLQQMQQQLQMRAQQEQALEDEMSSQNNQAAARGASASNPRSGSAAQVNGARL